jgi:hypothetical protein
LLSLKAEVGSIEDLKDANLCIQPSRTRFAGQSPAAAGTASPKRKQDELPARALEGAQDASPLKFKSITMEAMLRRFLPVCTALVVLSVLLFPAAGLHAQDDSSNTGNRWTRKYKAPPPSSRISVTVLKDDNGKPIENAAVIFHPIQGDKDKGYMELKSDEDGKAVIDVIPVGDTVRLQVIANGFQTYGGDYKIDKPEMSMQVRMKRPGAQYSIYNNQGATAGNSGGSGADKSASPDKNAAPAQNGKSGSSGNSGSSQSGSQSGSQSKSQSGSPSGSSSGQNQNQNQSQKQNQAQNQ